MEESGIVMSMRKESLESISGIVDVGIIVISHFENPARLEALVFLKKVLKREIKALIPVTTFLGAYYIMIDCLRIPRKEVKDSLVHTLKVRSPAFYEDISVEDAISALDYACVYNIESWDGYLVSLAKKFGCNVIYSIDKKLSRVEEIVVINPISEQKMKEYHEFIRKLTRKTKNPKIRDNQR